MDGHSGGCSFCRASTLQSLVEAIALHEIPKLAHVLAERPDHQSVVLMEIVPGLQRAGLEIPIPGLSFRSGKSCSALASGSPRGGLGCI